MGLFDNAKKPKEEPKPQRSGILELIFCPAGGVEDIMGRMEDALGVHSPGSGNRISIFQGDMRIDFTAFVAGKDTEDGKYTQEQLQGVWACYRQVKTEKVEVQRSLLYHLRQCRGMVQVNAVYDGPQNPDKEGAISERMGVVTQALQGVLTLGMDALVNPQGQIILGRDGQSDLEWYLPAELPLPEDWARNTPAECVERRNRAMALLRDRRIYVTPWLPLLGERETDGPARTVREVCGRAAALLIVSLYSECRLGEHMPYEEARAFVAPILDGYQAEEFLSPGEREYLNDPDSTEQTQVQYAWQYENLWVMEWALGLTDDLFWPDRICDVPASARLMQKHPTLKKLERAACLRPCGELLDQADLIYRLHWACVDARMMGMPAPQGLEEGVVMERHRALFWLAGCGGRCGWDDVDLST